MLAIGDKVELIDCPNKQHVGKNGKVALITTGLKPTSQPVVEYEKLPKEEEEPRYSVELYDGSEIHNLREQQLRKL